MPSISILLSIASFLILLGGLWAWRLTSSRPLIVNILLCSVFLLVGAYAATGRERPEFAFLLPFFATMLLAGRAVGFIWRSRKENDLRTPGMLVGGCATICAIAAVSAYLQAA